MDCICLKDVGKHSDYYCCLYAHCMPGHGLSTPHVPINYQNGREVGGLRESGKESMPIIAGGGGVLSRGSSFS